MYQVLPLKKACDEYMVSIVSIDNVLVFLEMAKTYNLKGLKHFFTKTLQEDFTFLLDNEKFLNVNLDVIDFLFKLKRHYSDVECKFFQKVSYLIKWFYKSTYFQIYEWVENKVNLMINLFF